MGNITGIGKSIAFKLARQGLNVVLVALGDPLLDSTTAEISKQFPTLQFRKVLGLMIYYGRPIWLSRMMVTCP
jgi:NAD(P)-dependent dehydrogenase (short-subunit alcohol dehydrogenase family)